MMERGYLSSSSRPFKPGMAPRLRGGYLGGLPAAPAAAALAGDRGVGGLGPEGSPNGAKARDVGCGNLEATRCGGVAYRALPPAPGWFGASGPTQALGGPEPRTDGLNEEGRARAMTATWLKVERSPPRQSRGLESTLDGYSASSLDG